MIDHALRTAVDVLACPVCESAMGVSYGRLSCSAGHSFDVAKAGYVNLLPPQHRTRGIEGDVPEMLRARRRFLDAGYYEPLRDAIAGEVRAALAARDLASPACVIETGCGEGYYIGGLGEAAGPGTVLLGTDLSKTAASMAARRYRDVLFFVSDVHRRLYLRSGAASLLLDVFAPRNPSESARVLEPGGTVLVVIPSAAHLAEVRAAVGLLDIQPEKERLVIESFAAGFDLAARAEVRYPLDLPPDAVADLVAMGPSRWHARAVAGPACEGVTATEASFIVLTLRRNGAAVARGTADKSGERARGTMDSEDGGGTRGVS